MRMPDVAARGVALAALAFTAVVVASGMAMPTTLTAPKCPSHRWHRCRW